MKIALAADHAGFEMKEEIKAYLEDAGHEVIDCGASEYDEGDDYPQFMHKAAGVVANDSAARAILFGGSGQGEAIVANRMAHVRAVVYCAENIDIVRLSREHNDANVLSIGARFISAEHVIEAIDIWLKTPFSGDERHMRRLHQIEALKS